MFDRMLNLPDGRVLCVREAGDHGGYPAFLFHGTPGARTFLADDAYALKRGIRLLIPDRPGYGRSTDNRHGTLLSWADDIRQVSDQLQLGRFGVAGVSGGGQYAAACAWRMPSRVSQAHLICSTAPLRPGETASWPAASRLKFELPRKAPTFLKVDVAMFGWMARRSPQLFSRLIPERSSSDRVALNQRREQLQTLLRDSFAQGATGMFKDLLASSQPWGFAISEITVPTHVWHGKQDAMSPFVLGQRLAEEIPGATPHFFPELGHMLLSDPRISEGWLDYLAARSRA
jgi:pimeloyl-ACP methyl ester carboxylesterase